MLTNVKRFPLVYPVGPGAYITVFEYQIGLNGELPFDDPGLYDALQEFVRSAFHEIGKSDNAIGTNFEKLFMRGWQVDEEALVNQFFKELASRNFDLTKAARLLIIQQNQMVRFAIEFIEVDENNEQNHISRDLINAGMFARTFSFTPLRDAGQQGAHRSVFSLEMTLDKHALYAHNASPEKFIGTTVMTGLESYVTAIGQIYNSIARVAFEQHRQRLQANGASISELAAFKAPSFVVRQGVTFQQNFRDAISRTINDRVEESFTEGQRVTSHHLVFNTLITTAPAGNDTPPKIELQTDIAVVLNTAYPDKTTTREYSILYTNGEAGGEGIKEPKREPVPQPFTPTAEMLAAVNGAPKNG